MSTKADDFCRLYSYGMLTFDELVEKIKRLNHFFCNSCRKWMHKEQHGVSFQNGPTWCQWCQEKD